MHCSEQEFIQAYEAEEARCKFVLERDGENALQNFAQQSLQLYVNAMNAVYDPNKKGVQNMLPSSREHKYKFFASCLVFETIIKE